MKGEMHIKYTFYGAAKGISVLKTLMKKIIKDQL